MIIDLTKKDLIRMVCGCSPSYENMDDRYGQYWGGFCDKWEWDSHKLNKLSEEGLWQLYQKLNEPPPKPKYVLEIEKKIAEVQAIMEDGIARNNKGQELSAKYEIERLRKLL
ncbi:hypothetical protein D3C85_1215300 [compost metagenome]